jgi:YggT family protein
MLVQLLMMIVGTAASFLCFSLLARFVMQWARVSFRNPLGQFTIAITDWAVRPARRFIPSAWGLDLPSLVLAWLVQLLALAVGMVLTQGLPTSAGFIGVLAFVALLETLKVACYLVEAAVIISAILSWVNPYAPMAPLLFAVTQPLLRPFQKIIPPIGGVDLSPIALLLVLQVLVRLLESARFQFPVMLLM